MEYERVPFRILGSNRQEADRDYSYGQIDYEQLKEELAWKLPREISNSEGIG